MKLGAAEEEEEEEEEDDYCYSGGGKDGLDRAVHLLAALITLSYTVKAFPVKWQVIRDKLLQLQAGLSPALDLAVDLQTTSQPLHHLISTIQGLLPSLLHCRRLARRCSDLSYSGKLLMQSDLDVATSKLSLHLVALDSVYSSGELSHPSALVVSRPGPSPSRDDVRFYLRDLFTRLKIGTASMRIHALASLNDVLADDSSRYARLIAAEIPDLASLLSNLLHRRSDPVVQEKSAEAVSILACFDACRAPLLGAGVVAHLVRALEDATDSGKESAARALLKLTNNSDNAWSLSAQGGVTVLLKICQAAAAAAADSGELASSACGILRNLVGVEEIKKFMVDEGAVSILVGLLETRRAGAKDEILQTAAIKVLQSMAAGDAFISRLVVREGAIEPLVRTLDPDSHFTTKTQEIALRAIDNFCLSPAAPCPGVLLDLRFVDRVLLLLRSGEAAAAAVYLQDGALKSALGLCRVSEEAKKQMGEAGFMPELVRLLESKSFEVRVTAAEVLWSLLSVAKNARKFIQDDEDNVVRLLRLVEPDQEEKPGHWKLLLSMLLALANCSSGRKRIAASCYVDNIRRLADAQVPEAKRIMRKLSENRFTSLLNGIWHK